MRRITAAIAFIFIAFYHFSKVPNNDIKNYSAVPILANIIDTSLTMIKGSVELNKGEISNELVSINLTSEHFSYEANLDSLFQFNFGYIEFGTYKITLSSAKFKENLNIEIYDSIHLQKGGIYELKILKGSWSSDSCCVIGSSFVVPIYFDLMAADLNSSDKVILQSVFETLVKYNLKVEIGVHFDERFQYEKMSTCLSCERANVIRNHLILLGIEPKNIQARGYESTKPFFLNAKTEEQHKYNRRIEVKIIE